VRLGLYINMNNIDKFGKSHRNQSKQDYRRIQTHIFQLTANGNYDIQGRKLRNIKSPTEEYDAANKLYVDNSIDNLKKIILQEIDERMLKLRDEIIFSVKNVFDQRMNTELPKDMIINITKKQL
jgi:hypothetical protein